MAEGNNVNVNGFIKTPNYNVNDNGIGKYDRARQVELIADKLMEKFKPLGIEDRSRPFMCKVAYKLSEARIWDNYEKAMLGTKNKIGLFIYLCKRDGV